MLLCVRHLPQTVVNPSLQHLAAPTQEPLIDTSMTQQSLLRSPALRHPPLFLCNFTQFCCPGSKHAANVRRGKEETSLQLKNQTIMQQKTDRFQPRALDLITHLLARRKLGNQSQTGSMPSKNQNAWAHFPQGHGQSQREVTCGRPISLAQRQLWSEGPSNRSRAGTREDRAAEARPFPGYGSTQSRSVGF